MTSLDSVGNFQAALWEAATGFGIEADPSSQVSIARELAQIGPNRVTQGDVRDAFVRQGLGKPPVAYAAEVIARIKRAAVRSSLHDVLLDYRRFAIDALSAEFGGKTKGQEESLRNNLRTYLPERGFVEARTGRGKTDIVFPPPEDALIEVKIWLTPEYYQEGLEEVRRYINTHRPKQAYIVVFCDREPLPPIVGDHQQEIAEEPELGGLIVPVIVVPFEVDAPSKARRADKRRTRNAG